MGTSLEYRWKAIFFGRNVNVWRTKRSSQTAVITTTLKNKEEEE
jgi:hypothetical protein